ncbi:conserved hypothetical protein (plasmid) [Candidatus Protochlamydia naegleriophila]|uniref:Uncharacterized protein n=1 Tax=Candidatus Protochlamydia naegleriophila TaxID=389348 RepID=A0A0U5EV60_9BACT|nr:hypothetical protein [Candidatus Protochlamydia naegleriophila]CUI18147.1 conserved hypothetical protein [Candidatus Protochlamydia naegleriophila]
MKHVEKSRINFDIPTPLHQELKIQAIRLGLSVRGTQALEDKLMELARQEEAEKIEKYHILMDKYEKGEVETISHDEMMKRVDWDAL